MSTPGGPDRDPYGPRTPEDAAYGPVPPAPPAWSVGPPAGSSPTPPAGPYPAPPAGPYPAQPGGYGAAVPGYGYPAYAPPPAPPSGGRGPLAAALFAVAAALVVLALAVGAHALAVGVSGAGLGDPFAAEPGRAYGDNVVLDGLWDDCEAGDGSACDELYDLSEIGSAYEDFGWTCGERVPEDEVGDELCEDLIG